MKKSLPPVILAIDIDDTISITKWPLIVGFKKGAKKYINKLYDEGYYIILWSCRCGIHLEDAVKTLKSNGFKFHQVNEHHPALINAYGNDTRKLSYDFLICDKNLWIWGMPRWSILYWAIKFKTRFLKKRSLGVCKPEHF